MQPGVPAHWRFAVRSWRRVAATIFEMFASVTSKPAIVA